MIGSVGQSESTPKITLSEFTTSKELMEKELDARVKSKKTSMTMMLQLSVCLSLTDTYWHGIYRTWLCL